MKIVNYIIIINNMNKKKFKKILTKWSFKKACKLIDSINK